jgi:hypothetical protein
MVVDLEKGYVPSTSKESKDLKNNLAYFPYYCHPDFVRCHSNSFSSLCGYTKEVRELDKGVKEERKYSLND